MDAAGVFKAPVSADAAAAARHAAAAASDYLPGRDMEWIPFDDAKLDTVTRLPLDNIHYYDSCGHCYVVATDAVGSEFRLLKFTKSDTALEYHLDKTVYNRDEIRRLLEVLKRSKSLQHGRASAILGCIRFTRGYYVLFATKRRRVARLGPHVIYEVTDVALVSMCDDAVSEAGGGDGGSATFGGGGGASAAAGSGATGAGASASSMSSAFLSWRTAEEFYREQFRTFGLKQYMYYCHTYDLTNTLQVNMVTRETERKPRAKYVWNEFLLEPMLLPSDPGRWQRSSGRGASMAQRGASSVAVEATAGQGGACATPAEGKDGDAATATSVEEDGLWAVEHGCESAYVFEPHELQPWVVHLVHGSVAQYRVRSLAGPVALTIIGRASKNFAGARYLRRGVSSNGHVANHVEIEQIVSLEGALRRFGTRGRLSSYVQVRGSVPVHWFHPPTQLPKPPIKLGVSDPFFNDTRRHLQELLADYGAPIVVMNFLKAHERRAREGQLTEEFRKAVRMLQKYATDIPQVPGARPLRLLQYKAFDLRNNAYRAWNSVTAFAEEDADAVGFFACHEARGVRLQHGVVRSNCVDCIDRTNLGQFFYGINILGHQLRAIGFVDNEVDVLLSQDVHEVMLRMYLMLGDAIAIQYGGSAQVGAGLLHRGIGWDKIMSIKRLYNNVVGDREKQAVLNLFLGRYQPCPSIFSNACNPAMRIPGVVSTASSALSLSAARRASAGLTMHGLTMGETLRAQARWLGTQLLAAYVGKPQLVAPGARLTSGPNVRHAGAGKPPPRPKRTKAPRKPSTPPRGNNDDDDDDDEDDEDEDDHDDVYEGDGNSGSSGANRSRGEGGGGRGRRRAGRGDSAWRPPRSPTPSTAPGVDSALAPPPLGSLQLAVAPRETSAELVPYLPGPSNTVASSLRYAFFGSSSRPAPPSAAITLADAIMSPPATLDRLDAAAADTGPEGTIGRVLDLAEIESDYYLQISGSPELSTAAMLPRWWHAPLRRYFRALGGRVMEAAMVAAGNDTATQVLGPSWTSSNNAKQCVLFRGVADTDALHEVGAAAAGSPDPAAAGCDEDEAVDPEGMSPRSPNGSASWSRVVDGVKPRGRSSGGKCRVLVRTAEGTFDLLSRRAAERMAMGCWLALRRGTGSRLLRHGSDVSAAPSGEAVSDEDTIFGGEYDSHEQYELHPTNSSTSITRYIRSRLTRAGMLAEEQRHALTVCRDPHEVVYHEMVPRYGMGVELVHNHLTFPDEVSRSVFAAAIAAQRELCASECTEGEWQRMVLVQLILLGDPAQWCHRTVSEALRIAVPTIPEEVIQSLRCRGVDGPRLLGGDLPDILGSTAYGEELRRFVQLVRKCAPPPSPHASLLRLHGHVDEPSRGFRDGDAAASTMAWPEDTHRIVRDFFQHLPVPRATEVAVAALMEAMAHPTLGVPRSHRLRYREASGRRIPEALPHFSCFTAKELFFWLLTSSERLGLALHTPTTQAAQKRLTWRLMAWLLLAGQLLPLPLAVGTGVTPLATHGVVVVPTSDVTFVDNAELFTLPQLLSIRILNENAAGGGQAAPSIDLQVLRRPRQRAHSTSPNAAWAGRGTTNSGAASQLSHGLATAAPAYPTPRSGQVASLPVGLTVLAYAETLASVAFSALKGYEDLLLQSQVAPAAVATAVSALATATGNFGVSDVFADDVGDGVETSTTASGSDSPCGVATAASRPQKSASDSTRDTAGSTSLAVAATGTAASLWRSTAGSGTNDAGPAGGSVAAALSGEASSHLRAVLILAESIRSVGAFLDTVDLTVLPSAARWCFFGNVFNALYVHSWLMAAVQPAVEMRRFYLTNAYRIGGHVFTLEDIKNGILRGNRPSRSAAVPPFPPGDARLALLPATHSGTARMRRRMARDPLADVYGDIRVCPEDEERARDNFSVWFQEQCDATAPLNEAGSPDHAGAGDGSAKCLVEDTILLALVDTYLAPPGIECAAVYDPQLLLHTDKLVKLKRQLFDSARASGTDDAYFGDVEDAGHYGGDYLLAVSPADASLRRPHHGDARAGDEKSTQDVLRPAATRGAAGGEAEGGADVMCFPPSGVAASGGTLVPRPWAVGHGEGGTATPTPAQFYPPQALGSASGPSGAFFSTLFRAAGTARQQQQQQQLRGGSCGHLCVPLVPELLQGQLLAIATQLLRSLQDATYPTVAVTATDSNGTIAPGPASADGAIELRVPRPLLRLIGLPEFGKSPEEVVRTLHHTAALLAGAHRGKRRQHHDNHNTIRRPAVRVAAGLPGRPAARPAALPMGG